jgi:chemotaxis protein histidine kinase CheA
MEDQPSSYRREFFKSPHHAVLGLATLGAGFILGASYPLALVIGAAAYVLGWIYLPDMPLFRGWVDRRHASVQSAAAQAEVARFLQQRDALLTSLSSSGRNHYQALAAVCRDIEESSAETPLSPDPNDDPRLRKLDDLMWTFLRLLSIEDSLNEFLETERRENIPGLVKEAEAEVGRLSAEYDALKAKAATLSVLDPKERLLNSKLERLDVLRKRLDRIQQAESNLSLVVSEQERLEQQVKLIRADAIASKNADTLSARIDATVEHLDQTNKWISEMSEFKDMVGELPESSKRIGYAPVVPPVIPQSARDASKSIRVKLS